jgi:hypothetical protein
MCEKLEMFLNLFAKANVPQDPEISYFFPGLIKRKHPDDLDTRKSTGTSCQIEIHFMIKTTEYLL